MSLDFTVAIPTYNGEFRLNKLLNQLNSQIGVEDIKWEIIIVDNNSIDKTAEVVKNYQKNCNYSCQLRYVLETRQGAAFARLRGISEARSELVGFLDDDILPALDWVKESILFGQNHPLAGAYSGQIHGDFEVQPPDNFARIERFLAINKRGEKADLYEPLNLSLPPGAALVIRKQAWCESVPKKLFFKGRLGKSMVGGEDLEPLLYMYKAGWEIWYNPTMQALHKIPHWRLERDYLLTLTRGCGLCTCYLRLINAKRWQKPIIMLRTIIGNLRRIIQIIVKYKGTLNQDIVALAEIEFYLGSIMSSVYYFKFYLNLFFDDFINVDQI